MKKLVAAVLAATIGTGAMASGPIVPYDPPVTPLPPLVSVYDWSGPYIGLRVGVPVGSNYWDERSVPGAVSDPGEWEGTLWGLTAGYDVQRGSMVFGAALDYTGGTITATSTTSATYNCATGCITEVENSIALRGRIGRAMDRTLIYATAGVAAAEATASIAGFGVLGNDRLTGWVAGFGFEHAFSNRFTVSLEFLHTNLGRLEIPLSCFSECFTDVAFGTIRLGANVRF